MSESLLIQEQFERVVRSLGPDPWGELTHSGFLDLLREDQEVRPLFPLALLLGRLNVQLPILETMVARTLSSEALGTEDLQAALSGRAYALPAAWLLTAGKMAGALEHVLAMTLEYARLRHQFGRPVSTFQAVQQQISQAAEEVTAARLAAERAFCGNIGDLSPLLTAAAKARAGQAAQIVCTIAHAVHGAIGVSSEYPLHNYTLWLRQMQFSLGGDLTVSRLLGEWALARKDSRVVQLLGEM